MSIDLRSRDICVPEHLLDEPDAGLARLQQMRRKCMPQRMRRDILKAGFLGRYCDKFCDILSR